MIHNIIAQGSIAAGASSSGSLAQQDLNGLVISAAGAATLTWNASDFLSVSLKSPMHTNEVLCNRVPVIALAHISDIGFGSSIGLQDVLAALTATDFSSIAFCVPLGTLKMVATDSELEVLLESGGTKTYSVGAYFNDDGTDAIRKTLETTVLRDSSGNVDKIFLFRNANIVDWSSIVLSAMIKGPMGTTLCNQMDLFGYTAVFGSIEAEGPRRVVCCFENQDDIQDTIYYQITGSDSANWTIITCTEEVIQARVSAGTRYSGGILLSRLDAKAPEERKALRRAGKVAKRSTIRSMLARANMGGWKRATWRA